MLSSFVGTSLLKVVGALLELSLQVVIARRLGPYDYGMLSFVLGTGGLMFYFLFGGIVKYIIKNVAVGCDVTELNRKYICVYAIPVSLVVLATALVFTTVWLAHAIVLAFAILLFMLANAVLYGLNNVLVATTIEYVIFRGACLALVSLLFLRGGQVERDLIVYCQVAAYMVSIICQWHWLQRLERRTAWESKQLARANLREILSFQGIEIAANVTSTIPRVIQYTTMGAVNAGYLAVALNVRNVITFIVGPTTKLFFGSFSRHRHDISKLRNLYRDASRWQLYLVLPIFLVTVTQPGLIAGMFGEHFTGTQVMVRVIACATLLEVAFGPASNFLQMTGRHRLELYNQLGTLAIFGLAVFCFSWLGFDSLSVPVAIVVASAFGSIIRVAQLTLVYGISPFSVGELLYTLVTLVIGVFVFRICGPFKLSLSHFIYLSGLAGAMILLLFSLSPVAQDRRFIWRVVKKAGGVAHYAYSKVNR